MWPVYLLSIFVEEAWASIPRVDAWGIASGMGRFPFGAFPSGHGHEFRHFHERILEETRVLLSPSGVNPRKVKLQQPRRNRFNGLKRVEATNLSPKAAGPVCALTCASHATMFIAWQK
jgi:hypothetical protein